MVKKQEGVKGLILCRGTHMGNRGQAGQESTDFQFAYVGDGPQLVKAHEALDPVAVRLLGVVAEMSGASGKAYPFEKGMVSRNRVTVPGNVQRCTIVRTARRTEKWVHFDRLSCKERE
jgi:hypothetical protein